VETTTLNLRYRETPIRKHEREDHKNKRKRMKINSKDMHGLNLCQLGHSFYIDLPGAKVVEKYKFFFIY